MARPGEQVLQQADRAAREASANRVAPGHREEDGDHERQVNDREKADPHWNEDLDQYRNQRDEDDRGPTELVDRDLVPRCRASPEWHDSAAHCGGGSPAGGVEGRCGFALGVCCGAGLACFGAGVASSPFAEAVVGDGVVAGAVVFALGAVAVPAPFSGFAALAGGVPLAVAGFGDFDTPGLVAAVPAGAPCTAVAAPLGLGAPAVELPVAGLFAAGVPAAPGCASGA